MVIFSKEDAKGTYTLSPVLRWQIVDGEKVLMQMGYLNKESIYSVDAPDTKWLKVETVEYED